MATFFLLVITAGILYACQEHFEHFESSYISVAAAEKAGEFDRGWLPGVLKPDATNIREWHDTASNEARGKFTLNDRVVKSLQTTCKPDSDVPRKTWPIPDWFPASISAGTAAKGAMQIFRCEDFFLAVDSPAGAGYFWLKYPLSQGNCGTSCKLVHPIPDTRNLTPNSTQCTYRPPRPSEC